MKAFPRRSGVQAPPGSAIKCVECDAKAKSGKRPAPSVRPPSPLKTTSDSSSEVVTKPTLPPKTPFFPLPSPIPLIQTAGPSLTSSATKGIRTSTESVGELDTSPSLSPRTPPTVTPVSTTPATAATGTVTRGTLLGQGSYKKAYNVVEDRTKVLVVVAASGRRALETELQSLFRLEKAGVRVVQIFGDVVDLGGNEVGVVMERLSGTEVKETKFGMGSAKATFRTAALGFGTENMIRQLQAVQNYIDANGGISDLQFWVSSSIGAVVFDPATLGTSLKNSGPKQMIDYLRSQTKSS